MKKQQTPLPILTPEELAQISGGKRRVKGRHAN